MDEDHCQDWIFDATGHIAQSQYPQQVFILIEQTKFHH